jgi:hypothetical protein
LQQRHFHHPVHCGKEPLVVPQPVLWVCIEAKNAGNDLIKLLRYLDYAPSAAIGANSVMIHPKIGRECVQQIA